MKKKDIPENEKGRKPNARIDDRVPPPPSSSESGPTIVPSVSKSILRNFVDGSKMILKSLQPHRRRQTITNPKFKKITARAILERKRKNRNMVSVPYPILDSHPGRPEIHGPAEHAFRYDYESTVYINPDTLSVDKFTVDVPVAMYDDHLEWHSFKVPSRDAQEINRKSKADEDTQREKALRTQMWIEEGKRNENITEDEMKMMRLRLKDLLAIPEEDFKTLLHEIRYRRIQHHHFRGKKRLELLEEKKATMIARKQKKWRRFQNKRRRKEWNRRKTYPTLKRAKVTWNWWRHKVWKFCRKFIVKPLGVAGFHEPTSAMVLHYCSCFHIATMAAAALVQQWFEIQELDDIFGSSSWGNPVLSRSLDVIGLALVVFACVLGIIGQFFKRGSFLWSYLGLYIVGMLAYFISALRDHIFALTSELQVYIVSEIYDYQNDPQRVERIFLKSIQTSFHCCGANGIKDYGYEKSLTPADGKFHLPKSCCDTNSYLYKANNYTDCYMTFGGIVDPIPAFVNPDGCDKPLQDLLRILHLNKIFLMPFLIFGCFTTLITFVNLFRHFKHFDIKSLFKKQRHEEQAPRKLTICEGLLQNILESSSGIIRNEMEGVAGTIDNIWKRLSEVHTISKFIPVIVDIIHENEVLRSTDPLVFARVVLGLRPKRFLSDELLDDEFQMLLEEAPKSREKRIILAQRDLIYRIQMHKVETPVRDELNLREDRAYLYPKLIFPLPRPLSGVRVTKWEWVDGILRRRDLYDIGTRELDVHDPQYLEEDRVISAPLASNRGLLHRIRGSVLREDLYGYFEAEQFRPQLEALSLIFAECQGILRDIRRRAILNLELGQVPAAQRLGKERKGSIDIDGPEVRDAMKQLYKLESLHLARMDWKMSELLRERAEQQQEQLGQLQEKNSDDKIEKFAMKMKVEEGNKRKTILRRHTDFADYRRSSDADDQDLE